jgi:hypothetical protein
MKQTTTPPPAPAGPIYILGASTRGQNTREALTSARGKKKGPKLSRVQAVIDGQICRISNKIERANKRRAKRKARRR